MALPSSTTERELLRLKARVAELEAEILHLKNPQSSSSEAEDPDSLDEVEGAPSVQEPTSQDDACVMDNMMEFEEDIVDDSDDVAIIPDISNVGLDLLSNMIEVETQEGGMVVDREDKNYDPKRYVRTYHINRHSNEMQSTLSPQSAYLKDLFNSGY